LDHFLAGQQAGLLLVELVVLLDLFVDLGVARLQELVAFALAVDLPVVPGDDEQREQHGTSDGEPQPGLCFLLGLAPLLGSPVQQVDPRHLGKHLGASPQAMISSVASYASARAFTQWRRVIWASGLAVSVGTPSCYSAKA